MAGGLSATQHTAPNRDTQRQAAMQQLNQRTHSNGATPAAADSRDAQRRAASQQLNHTAQRNNFRGYDAPTSHIATRNTQPREAAQRIQQSHPQLNDSQRQSLQRERQNGEKLHLNQDMMGQRSALQAQREGARSNVFSGNESRAPPGSHSSHAGWRAVALPGSAASSVAVALLSTMSFVDAKG